MRHVHSRELGPPPSKPKEGIIIPSVLKVTGIELRELLRSLLEGLVGAGVPSQHHLHGEGVALFSRV